MKPMFIDSEWLEKEMVNAKNAPESQFAKGALFALKLVKLQLQSPKELITEAWNTGAFNSNTIAKKMNPEIKPTTLEQFLKDKNIQ